MEYLLSLRFGGLAAGYLLTLVIANLFGAKGMGDYVLAITVLKLFTLLAKLGLDTTSIRFIASFASQDKWTSIFKFRKQVVSILSISSSVVAGIFTNVFSCNTNCGLDKCKI